MSHIMVAYSDVRPGDRIFNKNAYHPTAQWVRVLVVERTGSMVTLKTAIYDTYGHYREGVAIMRGED